MLPYCPQFCNVFPASASPVWQGRGAETRRHQGHRRRVPIVWRTLGFVGLRHRWRSQHAACVPPALLVAPHWLVMCTDAPIEPAVAHLWWTPRSICLYDDQASTHYQPWHAPGKTTADTRAVLPIMELTAREEAQQTRLGAAGTPAWTRGLAVRGAVDATLAALAHLPTCQGWREQQEAMDRANPYA